MLREPKDILLPSGQTLAACLEAHAKWLRGEAGGVRANLSHANLYCANLSCANLHCADLSGANLSGTNLYCADLSRANLYGANLSDANLRAVDLSGANLSHANLVGAKFKIAGQELTATETNFTRVVGSMHDGYRVGEYLKIGCKEHTIKYWLENVRAIADANDYTPAQVDEYERLVAYIALCEEETRTQSEEETKETINV